MSFCFECVKDSFSSLCLTSCFPCSSSAVFFPRGIYVNLAYFIILLSSDGNIFSSVRYSYLSIFPHDNADIFAASLLISYFNFSSLILPSTVMINLYILYKRFFLKDSFSNVKNYLMQEEYQ